MCSHLLDIQTTKVQGAHSRQFGGGFALTTNCSAKNALLLFW
jgi:hypothetical protein